MVIWVNTVIAVRECVLKSTWLFEKLLFFYSYLQHQLNIHVLYFLYLGITRMRSIDYTWSEVGCFLVFWYPTAMGWFETFGDNCEGCSWRSSMIADRPVLILLAELLFGKTYWQTIASPSIGTKVWLSCIIKWHSEPRLHKAWRLLSFITVDPVKGRASL